MEHLFSEPLQGLFYDPECEAPGPDDKLVSRKGMSLDREVFKKLKDEYYELRGWDVASGLPTKAQLEALQLGDVAHDLANRGLLK